MIQEVVTSKGAAAITSDQWYVVHSRLVDIREKRPYARGIHSEHADRPACRKAAQVLRAKLLEENAGVPAAERDEVFIRKPKFKTLKMAKTRHADAE